MERQFSFEEVGLAELRAVEGGGLWGWIKDAAGWVYDHVSQDVKDNYHALTTILRLTFRC
jgi:hypothetical protein